jgi:hypothetical protein
MRTTIALAALAASTFSLNAESAEVYTYYCKGRIVAVRMENVDAMTGTIAVDGRVFSDAHLTSDSHWSDGCGYNFQAADKDGSTVELCTLTHGYAALTIAEKGKKPLLVKCNMNDTTR